MEDDAPVSDQNGQEVDAAETNAADIEAGELRLLEALFFATAEPLDEASIAARLAPGSDVPALVQALAARYSRSGINLVRVAGGWAFRTAPDLAPRLMLERVVSRKLSRAAIETLAIVAYHQPVTRGEIEDIRGVALSRGILDALMETGWIRPKGHRATPGRPALWITTPAFLDHFGLDAIADLPGIQELKAAGLLDPRPTVSIDEGLNTGEDEAEPFGELGEAEDSPVDPDIFDGPESSSSGGGSLE